MLIAAKVSEFDDVVAQAALADHAFQPIVSTSTLRVHGFEALARLSGASDAGSVLTLLDRAAAAGRVRQVEQRLVTRAIAKFTRFEEAGSTRLFCNLDNRIYEGEEISEKALEGVIAGASFPASNLCLEISERSSIDPLGSLPPLLALLARLNIRIALDDFGVGSSSLQRLLFVEPHYVKIDRCFVDGLAASQRKQAIVAKLCGLAHALGFTTVAEGVEREGDFRAARELGCDLAQGYLIARPTTELRDLRIAYNSLRLAPNVEAMSPRVAEIMTVIEPILVDAPLVMAAARFRADPTLRLLPVVDVQGNVQGALYEEDVRRMLISDFGASLMANKGVDSRVGRQARRCAIGEAHATVETIVNSYVTSEDANGMLLAHEGRYVGYLSNNAVLRLAAEREVTQAREQNPLTHLPGNESIADQIARTMATRGPASATFFDFDHFKAFNDGYGFAAGDRALQIFADLLRGLRRETGAFVGHIGGDDFVVVMADDDRTCEDAMRGLCERFARSVESPYSPVDRRNGGFTATDRYGVNRFTPLLRVSAGVLHLPAARAHLTVKQAETQLSALKRAAKAKADGFAVGRLPESEPAMLQEMIREALA